ncbi:hypothetical protein I316_04606 [Kwoniella heveanensis BCC8398]|uniref:BRCA2 OB1 domain-containing protein n=1 Tax=Kwoniella heveanensis BCC8398 TaxID=1296120 RepID=A0A1B9GR41_9TREE|nr:hypothetical protein I316_04606 [Kwoniella heveanensis BCC8398]
MRSTIHSNPPLQTTQIQSQGQDAIADNILPTDVDDLLSGLGADDLDDFGDIDGADIEVDRSFESEVGSVGSFGPGVDVRPPVNPPESSKTITVGFSTGGGKVLAPPSRTAMEKARKMWTAEEENSDGASEHEPQDERERAKKPRLSDPSEPMPVIVGFSTGRGVAMPPPSAAAMKKAAQIFAEIDMHAAEEDPSFPTNADAGPSRLPQQSPQVVFSLASGKPAPKPSEASLARARQLMNEAGHGRYDEDGDIREPFRSLTPNSHLPQSTPPSAGFQLASGKPAPKPNAASLARARQLMQEAAQADTSDQRHVERRQNSSFPHVPPGDTSPQRTPPGAGFQLASGKKPPAPSDASLAEARRLMDGVNGHLGSDGMPSDPIEPDPFRPLPSNGLEPQPAPPASGFQLASGKQAAPVSESSLAEARLLLSDDGSEIHQHAQPDSLIGPTTGFTMGSGKPAPPIKPASLAAVRNLFGDEENQQTFAGPCLPTTGLTLGSGKAASTPSQSSMTKAVSLFNDIDTNTATPVRPRPQPPIRANSPALTPLIRNRTGILPPTTPLRTPSATANSLSSIKRPIAIKTPSATSVPRRIGLGSTPSQHRIKKGFSTPFKTPQATRQVVPSDAKPVIHYQPVFNLEPSPERQTYKSAFLHPQYYSIEELEDMKIPDEIWQIGAHNAALYCFYTVGSSMGHEDALLTLRAEGCTLATARWVENHWIQILWKIAGTIQAKPDLFLARWSYDEVINQLRYRYEREYGNAQRPILKRIQEHDSSPSLPMVLFVYAIEYGQGEDAEKCFLELSDGWYRIRAMIDDCLLRAVRKGKLTVGRKLAVTGAKLESGNDGTEVLDAFRSSHLIITGNSTSLARWHTRLGLHSHPFIASLGSLSIDGGAVTLMDIVLEKVFPIAFMNGGKGNKEAPWGEEEEQIRQDAWTDRYTAERTRLQEEMRRQMDKMEDLASLLVQSAEESDPVSDEPPDGLESEYDDLLEAKNVLARLKGMSTHHIVHLARYAQARYNQEMADQQGDIERDLAKLCPPRDVRDFRMVRFVDAQTGVREQFRVGMLNVWDVRALGEGCLQEGKRYLVSNLLPARSGEWTLKRDRASKAEIYLHTRRDTRWQPI